MGKFLLSSNATMFIYPLQVRLYELLLPFIEKNQLIEERWLIDKMSEFGYRTSLINSEISRFCYGVTLQQQQWGESPAYQLTPWGAHQIKSIYDEASGQPNEIVVKIARRGPDNYQMIVRDTSFLTPATRERLPQCGFRSLNSFEYQRSRAPLVDIINICRDLLIHLQGSPSPSVPAQTNNTAVILDLIEQYGKIYKSIREKYVHYTFPYQYSWQPSTTFNLLCRAILAIGKAPVEWRGKPFTEGDIYHYLETNKKNFEISSPTKRCFQYLLKKGFIRPLSSPEVYTLTGQGAIWLKPYFLAIDENYSNLDIMIRHNNSAIFDLRLANSSYLPLTVRSIIEELGCRVTPEWFYFSKFRDEQVLYLLERLTPVLTAWKKIR